MPEESARRWSGSMPDAYERWLVPTVFRPFAVDLARRAATRQSSRALELAAGTGVLTRELVAALPSAAVVATDFNQAMVDEGRRHAPTADWRQADAMSLGFDDADFDLIVCQFGVMFFPDRQVAFADARRVLRPGGTFLLNTWDALAAHDFQAALVAALERAFPDDPPTFIVEVPHGCADPDPVVADLRAGGFSDVQVETVTLEGQAASAADVAAGYCTGTPLRGEIESRGDLETAMELVTEAMAERLGSGAITGRMAAHVFQAS